MKRSSLFTRIISLAILTVVLVGTMTGCFLINKKWEGDIVSVTAEATECVTSFAETLVNGNIEDAKSYLHPNCSPSADEIEQYVKDALEAKDIEFTEDVEFAFDGFNPEIVSEYVKYDIAGHATVGGQTISIKLGVMKDENGLGIYSIVIE